MRMHALYKIRATEELNPAPYFDGMIFLSMPFHSNTTPLNRFITVNWEENLTAEINSTILSKY